MLLWCAALTNAWGMPFQLPSAEPVDPWTAPLDLAGFEPGVVDDETVGVRAAAVEDVGWRLRIRDEQGDVRVVWVPFPRSPDDREAIVWLVDSLVRPVADPARPAPPPPEPPVEAPAAEEPVTYWVVTIVKEPAPPPPAPAVTQAAPEVVVAPVEAPPQPPPAAPREPRDVRVLASAGGALRDGLGPVATAGGGVEADLTERWFVAIAAGHGLRNALEITDPNRSAARWEAEAGLGWTLPGDLAPRIVATAGAARVAFAEDGLPVGSRVVPCFGIAGSADLAATPFLAVRPRVGLGADLQGILVTIDGEPQGILSPWSVRADLSLVVTPK